MAKQIIDCHTHIFPDDIKKNWENMRNDVYIFAF